MENGKWVDTKIEYEYNSEGEAIPKKVTRELKRTWFGRNKDEIDTFFRVLGIGSFIIPVWIFVNASKVDAKKRLDAMRAETYVVLLTKLHETAHLNDTSHFLPEKINELATQVYPKVMISDNQKVLSELGTTIVCFEIRLLLSEAWNSLEYAYGDGHNLQTLEKIMKSLGYV